MAKVSNEARVKYTERIRDYKNQIERILKEEQKIQKALRVSHEDDPYKKLLMAEINFPIISNLLIMNQLSIDLLGVKNENHLNDARKVCYKIVIYLEDVFSSFLDVPYSEYGAKLEAVQDYSDLKRFHLIKKLGFSVSMVKDGFGENSKWKWSIIELEGRVAVLSKNVINLKCFVAGMDPRAKGFRERKDHFKMTCRLLQSAADDYRMKYELSTNRIDDFKTAIDFLSALKRFLVFTNQKREVEELKKKIDIWKQKMESDTKVSERKGRLKRLSN